ncbi:MAG: hypothetical protein IT372_06805 [Polyangiaceae bacterium]|nr:hypothetical protein [Polyangiaceae bacterium]
MSAAFVLPGTLHRRLLWLAGRLHVSPQDAYNLAQSACLELIESGDLREEPPKLPDRDVVDRVAANLARRERRRAAREILMDWQGWEEIEDEAPDPEVLVMMKQKAEFWRSRLAEVPEDCRVVFVDHEILGLSFREIAAARGIPISTAQDRSRRGLVQLARAVERWRAAQRRSGRDDTLPIFLPEVSTSQRLFRAARAPAVRFPAAMAALVVAGVGWVSTERGGSRLEPEPPATQAAAQVAPAPAPVSGPPASAKAGSAGAPARAVPSAPPSSRAPGDPLESELMQRARGALSLGDEQEARRCLEDHLLKFPVGPSSAERDALLRRLAD